MVAVTPEFMEILTFGMILFLSLIISDVSRRLGQSEVIGLVLFGIIIGPYMLHLLEPTPFLKILGELGLLLMLFIAGLETNVKEVIKMGMTPVFLAIGGVIFNIIIIMIFIVMLTNNVLLAFFLASAASATSVGITMKVFSDHGKGSSKEAKLIIIAAIVDDIIALFLLILSSEMLVEQQLTLERFFELLWSLTGYFLTMIGLSVIVSTYLMRTILKLKARGAILMFALSFAIISSYFAVEVGLSPLVGAFIAGVILSETAARDEVIKNISPIAIVTIPIFFVIIGMQIDVTVLYKALFIGLVYSVLAIIGKVLGGIMTGELEKPKMSTRKSLLLGFGMVPRGEVGLIFAGIGITMGILNEYWYSALIVMVLVTTFITPLILKKLMIDEEEEGENNE